MTEEHKKRLCELAGYSYHENCRDNCDIYKEITGTDNDEIPTCPDSCYCKANDNENYEFWLAILIKAMWAINENDFSVYSIKQTIHNGYAVVDNISFKEIDLYEYRQQALEAALIYKLDNE